MSLLKTILELSLLAGTIVLCIGLVLIFWCIQDFNTAGLILGLILIAIGAYTSYKSSINMPKK